MTKSAPGGPAPASAAVGPLAGLRVLDLTRFLSGPMATMVRGTTTRIRSAPPLLVPGQHTDEVLEEIGYAADEIDQLRAAGVVA